MDLVAKKTTSSDLTPMQMQKADEALHGFEVNILKETNLLFADIALGTFTDILKSASEEQQLLLIKHLHGQIVDKKLLERIMAYIKSQSIFLRAFSNQKILEYARKNAEKLDIPPRIIQCLEALLSANPEENLKTALLPTPKSSTRNVPDRG